MNEKEQKDAVNFFYIRAARYFSESGNFTLANQYFKRAITAKAFSIRNVRALVKHIKNRIT
ncbi:hypothetical protein A3715_22930 [Oleiphilus sp. HI0009]|nr:hypothetical protein A3715_22930 [Oleiphilus sp. HI0009]